MTNETDRGDEKDCMIRLSGVGKCDLTEGHYPATPHLLINVDDDVFSKVIWPIDDDDPDVKHYLAVAQAYEDEDNRRMAEQAAGE